MKTFHGSRNLPRHLQGGVVTLGVFDGVHLAHQVLLRRTVQKATRRRRPAIAYTFHPHPARVLAPMVNLSLLMTLEQRSEAMAAYKLDALVIERFTRSFSRTSARLFFQKLVRRLQPVTLLVGYDFTFGQKREGTVELLEQLGKEYAVEIVIVSPLFARDCLISSTEIRNAVRSGEMRRAALLLGRPFFIDGTVVPGRRLGRTIGLHTANLRTPNEILPPLGVYATRTILGRKIYRSVTNIGHNPTFGGRTLSIETHLLDFSKNIYNRKIRLQFFDRLRDEKTFSDPDALRRQILRDGARARKILRGQR